MNAVGSVTDTPFEKYEGGENFDLKTVLTEGRSVTLQQRLGLLKKFLNTYQATKIRYTMREIVSPPGREVLVRDRETGVMRPMRMFGSNNYLGFADHPYIREKVAGAIEKFGVGVGGPPLLNGYHTQIRELEQRMADFKESEDCVIFSSGYAANLGAMYGLLKNSDHVFFDQYSHASFIDGLRISKCNLHRFNHNDVIHLREELARTRIPSNSDCFVGVESVYSMDGDIAPLDEIVKICKKSNSWLYIDDAHATGVIGKKGKGSLSHFGITPTSQTIQMGTFSKTFAVTGGFICAPKSITDFIRYMSRSYIFSASLPPMSAAAILAGLDMLQGDTWLIEKLRSNVRYAYCKLKSFGLMYEPAGAILSLKVPVPERMKDAVRFIHDEGFFVNYVEYPAVPVEEQRFRISIMATHTEEDIDALAHCFEKVWSIYFAD